MVATANEPTALDAAILRRPGRFDRVIHFPNSGSELRYQYFRKMNPAFETTELSAAVKACEDFSFAQLREAYILAGQRSFEDGTEINTDGLLRGIECLRAGFVQASKRGDTRGFQAGHLAEVIA